VVERKNNIIVKMAICMLKGRRLPNSFWVETINTTVHVLHRSLTKSVKGKTPKEVWLGKNPDMHFLRIFGCKAFVHVPKEEEEVGGHVNDYSHVRHSPGHKPEREPLRGVCGSYLRQRWNVEMASSLQKVEKNSG
jgi:hypothetical protein